jgi:hypothetical protein
MKVAFSAGLLVLMLGGAARGEGPVTDPLQLLDLKPEKLTHTGRLSLGLRQPIEKGLEFLDLWQSPNGSWDRLENSDPSLHPRHVNLNKLGVILYDGPLKDIPDVQTEELADTCLSAQAMLRAVVSGRKPALSKNCLKAIEYVCGKARFWNADTIMMQTRWLDPLHDQNPANGEPGYYTPVVDTFFVLSFLVEARSRIENPQYRKMLDEAIPIVLRKIERSQGRDGGWADPTDPLLGMGGHTQDIRTHCVAVSALNKAVRLGFPVNPRTKELAERSFLKNRGMLSVPLLAVSTLYNMELTRFEALRAAQSRMAAGEVVSPRELLGLERDAIGCRRVLEEEVQALLKTRDLHLNGPRLEGLDEVLAAVREVAPQDFPRFAMTVRDTLQARQRSDGHFIADIFNNDSIASRGENTFGTATTVMTLMELDNREKEILEGTGH